MNTLVLDEIKASLLSNSNLDNSLKDKILSLVVILNKKLPDVNLSTLSERLKTVRIGRLSKLERRGTSCYDLFQNEILFSRRIEENYDLDHLFMKAILQMSTATETFTGFNSDDRLRALNLAYTEILANFLVGNEGPSDFEEEMLVTNLLSHVIGKDTMFNSYFSNNGEPIIRALQDAEVGLL